MDYYTDRSWMYGNRKHRYTTTFVEGVMFFLKFAFDHMREGSKEIRCPCTRCQNKYWRDRSTVHDDVVYNGFVPDYFVWEYHGEEKPVPNNVSEPSNEDDMEGMVNDAFGIHDGTENEDLPDIETRPGRDDYAKKFENLVNEVDKPLYKGCKFSQLSFVVRLFNIKCLGVWSNKSFSMLLELLKDVLPEDVNHAREDVDHFKEDAKRAWEEVEQERIKTARAEANAKAANERFEAVEEVQRSTFQMLVDLQRQFGELQRRI